MLTMRILLVVAICTLAGSFAYAESQQTQQKPSDHKKTTATDKRGTENSPLIIKVLPSNDAESAAKDDREEKAAKRKTDEDLAKFTGQLAEYTNNLASYTKILVGIGIVQIFIFIGQLFAFLWQGRQLKRSVDSAENTSMPFLSPLIVGGILHPFRSEADHFYPHDQPVSFPSSVHFVFENFGKTPGMIQEVRGDLFLCEMDQFPAVDFGQLPLIDYQPIVAGDSRGEQSIMAVGEYTKSITLTQTEFTELLAPADNRYRRFAFIGRVVYDDFFDNRHFRRFCVKTRRMDNGLFQIIRGGRAYNHVDRQKTPENE
jgi:hypothetical protein